MNWWGGGGTFFWLVRPKRANTMGDLQGMIITPNFPIQQRSRTHNLHQGVGWGVFEEEKIWEMNKKKYITHLLVGKYKYTIE